MKRKRSLLWLIILTTIVVSFIAIPQNPININIAQVGFEREITYQLGLDLQGGTSLTLEADMSGISTKDTNDALEGAKTVIERRVNLLGVSEPVIQTAKVAGSHRIIVELPGIKETEQAIRLIGTTAQLTFWETDEASPSSRKMTDLTGKDLKKAGVVFDPNTGKPQVALEFTNEGAKKFADITRRNVGKQVAMVLDGEIISDPNVNEPIVGGNAVITGNFSVQEAKTLAIELNAGALPVPLKILQQRTIGATLGQESMQKSLIAGVAGFALVAAFMIILYRILGIFAVTALIIYALIVLSVFKLIPVTLTLSGIAAFILSIGMAVDANILIFERFREETRWAPSAPKQVALEAGFARAWTSIRDSNISTLITAAILYYFGIGVVRGFALVLAIGVLVSMFSAIVVTRTLLRLVIRN